MSLWGQQHTMRDGLVEMNCCYWTVIVGLGIICKQMILHGICGENGSCAFSVADEQRWTKAGAQGNTWCKWHWRGLTWLGGKHLCAIRQVGTEPCQWLFCDRESRLKYWEHVVWSTVSNAELKSRSIRATTWPWSIAQTICGPTAHECWRAICLR